jgi:hypothetical protein
MRIEIRGDGGRGVAQPVAHHLDVNAGRQREAGVGVPEVVQADTRHAGPGDELGKQVSDSIRPE